MNERLLELLNGAFEQHVRYRPELTEYLIANGVFTPPCKIGDSVWFLLEDDFPVHKWCLSEEKVTDVSAKGFFTSMHLPAEDDHGNFTPWGDVGTEAFFDKTAAEQALAEKNV